MFNETNPKTKKNKKTLTRWKQKKNKKMTIQEKPKNKKNNKQVLTQWKETKKQKNKFDHMEVFDKVLDTSYPQKVPLLNKPLIKYIYFTPFIHQTISI